MSRTTDGKVANSKSGQAPEVSVNQNALVVGVSSYPIDEIKEIEVKHNPWQFGVAVLCFLLGIVLYFFAPHLYVQMPWGQKPLFGGFTLLAVVLGIWGNSRPAQLILQLPDRRLQVLEAPEKELKAIKAKIKDAKKVLSAGKA